MRDRSFIEFAEANRLKVKRDECNDQVIPGKLGDIWEYGPGSMAVTIYEDRGREITKQKWTYCKRACLKVGMTLEQDGDREGTLLFDPENAEQVKTAIKVAKIFHKRRVSEEQREALIEAGAEHRFQSTTAQEGSAAAQIPRGGPRGYAEGGERVRRLFHRQSTRVKIMNRERGRP